MSGLIDDILDLARGRLGGRLILELADQQLEPMLTQIIAELQTSCLTGTGGLIDVTSSPEGTCFTFRMPLIDGPPGALRRTACWESRRPGSLPGAAEAKGKLLRGRTSP